MLYHAHRVLLLVLLPSHYQLSSSATETCLAFFSVGMAQVYFIQGV